MSTPWHLRRLRFLLENYVLKRSSLRSAWKTPIRINENFLAVPDVTLGWYLDHTAELGQEDFVRDDHGVPMIDYANIGRHYNPWFVSQIALAYLLRHRLSGSASDLAEFRLISDWLVQNAHVRADGLTWFYCFDWNHGRTSPWISALSQGMAVATLLRAGHVFDDDRYIITAEKAMTLFQLPMSAGGVSYFHPDGTVSFEEVVSPECTENPLSTLNGHLFALWALRDWVRETNSAPYRDLLERACAFVRERLRDYDLGFWSAYNLFRGVGGIPAIASSMYHELHIAQLEVQSRVFGDDIAHLYAERFSEYQQSRFCRSRALATKVVFKLAYF